MKSVKEIFVENRADCLVWSVDTDGDHAKNVDINIDDGCYAVMYFNGRKFRAFPTGLYNFEWRMYEKNSGKITLTAVNIGGTVKLAFGAGNISYEFNDGASDIGVNGSCTVKPIYAKSLPENERYAACDKLQAAYSGKRRIGADEIGAKWRGRLSDIIKTTLAAEVKSRAGFTRAMLCSAFDGEIKSRLVDALYALSDEFGEEGLEIDDIVLDRLFIADAPAVEDPELDDGSAEDENGDASQDGADETAEEDERTDEVAEETENDDAPDSADEPSEPSTGGETAENVGGTGKKNVCEKCGCDNTDAAKFCKNCGAALCRGKTVAECPNCHRTFERGTKFCKFCGEKIVESNKTVCPTCKKTVPEGSVFCRYCGAKLD